MSIADSDVAFADYGDILRRRWKFVVLGVTLGLLAAIAALYALPKTYTSTASVMVLSTGEDGAVEGGRTSTSVNLDTEAQIVKSTVVSQLALESIESLTTTDASDLAKHVAVSVPPNTSVLNISFSAPSREAAQEGATAYANAYLTNRGAVAKKRIDSQADAVDSQLEALEAQISAVDRELSRMPPESTERYGAEVRREQLASEVATLNSTLAGLQSSTVTPGEVITEAQLPFGPSSPNTVILLASGILGGLLFGLLAGYLVDRLDRRVRDRRALDNLGVDTLAASITVTAPVEALSARSAEAMRQVRNGLLVRLPDERPSVLVANASNGVGGSLVALHLADTIARSGIRVLLVSANSSHCIVEDSFRPSGRQTLADLILGLAEVDDILHEIPRQPNLTVVGAGALDSELLMRGIGSALESLSPFADIMVVDVAPASNNADAQSIASLSSGVLLVAEAMHTKRSEVSDAIDQFRHVAAPLFGGVVVAVARSRSSLRHWADDGSTGRQDWRGTDRSSAREQTHGPRVDPLEHRSDEPQTIPPTGLGKRLHSNSRSGRHSTADE